MKIIDHKDAINRRLYEGLMIVETPINTARLRNFLVEASRGSSIETPIHRV